MLIGLAKLLTICLTVLSGFRGGFIFPLFFAGTAFGKGFALMPIAAFGHFPPVLFAMTIAAGLALPLVPLAAGPLPSDLISSHLVWSLAKAFIHFARAIKPQTTFCTPTCNANIQVYQAGMGKFALKDDHAVGVSQVGLAAVL